MTYNSENPLIVQSDKSILLEVNNPLYEVVRDYVSGFAELEKSPEHIHTYRITPLSLWNAASSGMTMEEIIRILNTYSKFPIPQNIVRDIADQVKRYGKIRLIREEDSLVLISDEVYIISEIASHKKIQPYLLKLLDPYKLMINKEYRGHVKHALIKIGYPVEDLAGYESGTSLDVALKDITSAGMRFSIRDYQRKAVDAFYAGGSNQGGSGVVVLPCGAGKTIVGMAAMESISAETLILTTNITALRQWKQELLDKTSLTEDMIGEYSGATKDIRPVTIATYQILTYRKNKQDQFTHIELFNKKKWGFILYDEVHLLPAPVFRITAEIQAKRRLGLTATLVREDGLEEDVFSLIGPKKYDVPWKILETKGWIASAQCIEIRVPMSDDLKMTYAVADSRQKFRVASENQEKLNVVLSLLESHKEDNVLIIGQYIDQLMMISNSLQVPVITGKTSNDERLLLYDAFKKGDIKTLVVSKVANFAIDLPDANIAIQISGTFGSRQEEAQRLGRILRPKPGDNTAVFYSLVTADSREQEFAANRQLFLTEQGYQYTILDSDEIGEKEICLSLI